MRTTPAEFAEQIAKGKDGAIINTLIAIEGLGTKGTPYRSEVAKLLTHANKDVRHMAIKTYILTGGNACIPDTLYLLDDPDPSIQATVAWAFTRVGGKHVGYPFLRKMLASDERSVRKAGESMLDFVDRDFSVDTLCAAERAHAGDPEAQMEEVERKDFQLASGQSIDVRLFQSAVPEIEAKHQSALEGIAAIDKRLLRRIAKDLAEFNDEELDEDDGPPEEAIEVQHAVIPPHNSGKDIYYFLLGESDFDMEHGFACLFKNKRKFCFVERDFIEQIGPYTMLEEIATLFSDCSGG